MSTPENNQNTEEEVRDLSALFPVEYKKFIPDGYPELLPDGRKPLRRQIFEEKKILNNVLTKPKKGVYMCNHCDNLFSNFGELLDHFDEFKIKRPHKCTHDDCPWKIVGFNRVRQLHRHLDSVHNTEKEHRCVVPGCKKNFGRMDLLNRHIRSVHENKNSRFNKKMVLNSTNASTQNSPTTSASSSPNSPSLLTLQHPPQDTQQRFLLHHSTLRSQPQSQQASSSSHIIPSISSAISDHLPHTPSALSDHQHNEDSDDSTNQENNYKHSIKFLTNSDD